MTFEEFKRASQAPIYRFTFAVAGREGRVFIEGRSKADVQSRADAIAETMRKRLRLSRVVKAVRRLA